MSRAQRAQRPVPGLLSTSAKKAAREKPPRNAPAVPVRLSTFVRFKEILLGTRFPKVMGGADAILFGTVVALIVFGVVMVYSASSVRAVRMYHDGHHFLVRQAAYAAVGLPIVLFLARFDYHRLRGLGLLALSGAVSLLL